MKTEPTLRYALLSNAVFSATSALLMLLYPAVVGQWLGLDAPLFYRVVGSGLLIFALDLVHQATRPRIVIWRAYYASAADFSWVVGTLGFVVFKPTLFSSEGKTVIIATAVIVLGFGVWQLRGIILAHRPPAARTGN